MRPCSEAEEREDVVLVWLEEELRSTGRELVVEVEELKLSNVTNI